MQANITITRPFHDDRTRQQAIADLVNWFTRSGI
jgi:hypothetical protein